MKRRGSVLMEFIIVAPLMLILISMILQFAQIWIAREITAYAAYCATRAVLSANKGEAKNAARCAAEMACSWMALAGFKDSTDGTTKEVDAGQSRLYGTMADGRPGEDESEKTVYLGDGSPVKGEIEIPGLGTIPGSDSIRSRIEVTVLDDGSDGFARVSVQFKFPLLMPLAGRLISWTANRNVGSSREGSDYGSHALAEGNDPAWKGQQVVMNEDGTLKEDPEGELKRSKEERRVPVIYLTEACALPMPYTSERLYESSNPVFGFAHVPQFGEDD